MDDIAWTDKRDHQYWYTVKCSCGAEGEIGLPISFRGTFGCPDPGCMGTFIQWESPQGIRVKCVVEPVFDDDYELPPDECSHGVGFDEDCEDCDQEERIDSIEQRALRRRQQSLDFGP